MSDDIAAIPAVFAPSFDFSSRVPPHFRPNLVLLALPGGFRSGGGPAGLARRGSLGRADRRQG